MERDEFLRKLGIGLVAACTGCSLVSCGGKGNNPGPSQGGNQPPPVGSGEVFSADLTKDLVNIGDSMVLKGVIVVRLEADEKPSSFIAVQVACTHEGNSIGYNKSQGIFICPAHGSEFSKSGQVLVGPAALPLHQYTVTIDNNHMLTVNA